MSDRESIHIQALELRFEGADFSSEADQRLVRDVLAMVNDGIEAATVALVRHPELARHPMSVSFLQSWLSPLKQRSLSLAVQKSFLVVVGGVTVIAVPAFLLFKAGENYEGLFHSIAALVIAVDAIVLAFFTSGRLASVEDVYRRVPITRSGGPWSVGSVDPGPTSPNNKPEDAPTQLVPPFVIFEVIDGSIVAFCQRAAIPIAVFTALSVGEQIVQGSKVGKMTISKGIEIVDTATDIVAERFSELAALKHLEGKGQVKKDRLIIYFSRRKPEDDVLPPKKPPKAKKP